MKHPWHRFAGRPKTGRPKKFRCLECCDTLRVWDPVKEEYGRCKCMGRLITQKPSIEAPK